jgi:hypothetical protein
MGRPRIRWADVVQRDARQLLGIGGWRSKAANKDEWRRLMREAKVRKGLERHGWKDFKLIRTHANGEDVRPSSVHFCIHLREYLMNIRDKAAMSISGLRRRLKSPSLRVSVVEYCFHSHTLMSLLYVNTSSTTRYLRAFAINTDVQALSHFKACNFVEYLARPFQCSLYRVISTVCK